jgi:hypothetical protein
MTISASSIRTVGCTQPCLPMSSFLFWVHVFYTYFMYMTCCNLFIARCICCLFRWISGSSRILSWLLVGNMLIWSFSSMSWLCAYVLPVLCSYKS